MSSKLQILNTAHNMKLTEILVWDYDDVVTLQDGRTYDISNAITGFNINIFSSDANTLVHQAQVGRDQTNNLILQYQVPIGVLQPNTTYKIQIVESYFSIISGQNEIIEGAKIPVVTSADDYENTIKFYIGNIGALTSTIKTYGSYGYARLHWSIQENDENIKNAYILPSNLFEREDWKIKKSDGSIQKEGFVVALVNSRTEFVLIVELSSNKIIQRRVVAEIEKVPISLKQGFVDINENDIIVEVGKSIPLYFTPSKVKDMIIYFVYKDANFNDQKVAVCEKIDITSNMMNNKNSVTIIPSYLSGFTIPAQKGVESYWYCEYTDADGNIKQNIMEKFKVVNLNEVER